MRNDFVIFILTHGRPDNVYTIKTLQKCNYDGNVIFVVDNEDDTVDKYVENFGKDRVYVFDKLAISKTFDTADTFNDRRTIVYARNECFNIAKEKGYKYFLELDDDYTSFEYRYIQDNKLKVIKVKDINKIIDIAIDFLEKSKALTVAFAQGGDFIGGSKNKNFQTKLLRKAMNSFFCKTDRKFTFVGRVNEDVNTYVSLGGIGKLLFTFTDVALVQKATQSNKSGMTDVYLNGGTYLKSFYSVLYRPDCVKIAIMGDKHKRVHHNVDWNACCPKILNEKYRK